MLTGEEDRRRAIGGARPRLLGSNRDGARFLQSGLLGGAAVALVMGAPASATEVPKPCPPAAPMARHAAAEESWLQRQIRRFRGYPHDVAARQTYLVLLYAQGRYAETACEATSLFKDESQNASVLVYRALA